jgi:putative ATP-binding cassette transporter
MSGPAEASGWGQARALLTALARAPMRRPAGALAAGVAAALAGNAALQVALNAWQGDFYDALALRDFGAFAHQVGRFLLIASGLLALIVAQTWLQETLKVRLRAWLTEDVTALWLTPGRVYRLGFAGPVGEHPDQRMHEDARKLIELSVDLAAGLLQATLMLVCFVAVLFVLSERASFVLNGVRVELPGYLVVCALAFSVGGSVLAWAVGRPLVALNADRYGREAELRFEMVRVGEAAEGVALHQGEADERRRIGAALGVVTIAAQRIADRLARLTWVTSGYGWLALIVPFLAAAPGYFAGDLSLGGMMMVVGAFVQVQQALRWYVDSYARIADARATLLRVTALRDALGALEDGAARPGRIRYAPHPAGGLSLRGLSVALPEGCAVIEGDGLDIAPGEALLVTGDPLSGKSAVFRAVAGLWPWGEGSVLRPAEADMMFLPNRPYLPPGPLRDVVAYPSPPGRYDDEAIADALRRLDLGHLVGALDRSGRWDRALPLDEQQRLALARAVLRKPRWLLIDDAADAMPAAMKTRALAALRAAAPGASLVLFQRGPGGSGAFDRTARIVRRERPGLRVGA